MGSTRIYNERERGEREPVCSTPRDSPCPSCFQTNERHGNRSPSRSPIGQSRHRSTLPLADGFLLAQPSTKPVLTQLISISPSRFSLPLPPPRLSTKRRRVAASRRKAPHLAAEAELPVWATPLRSEETHIFVCDHARGHSVTFYREPYSIRFFTRAGKVGTLSIES